MEKKSLESFWDLKKFVSKDFYWLYANDRDWLMDRAQFIGILTSSKNAVDWQTRDNFLAEAIKIIVAEILAISDDPVRISVSEIVRRTSHGPWILNERKNLPKSDQLIALSVETTGAFKNRYRRWQDAANLLTI